MQVRTRIAPSPTGEDLHIGNVYTALINYAFAKKNNGKFIIRIEDTDKERLVKGSEEKILKSLKNFGLNYDEGPDVDGPYKPYKQSERIETYKKYADELIEKGQAYYCFCSKEKIEEIREKEKKEKKYQRHIIYCQPNLEDAKKRIEKADKFVIRLKVPDNEDISFEDYIRGEITINTKEFDDQILLKSDGFPTYHLAVVVDDHLMEISHVIRADEWISSTPKHVLLYRAFGWEMPIHAHVPLLRNPDKSKLSKRKNPVWSSWYLEQGFLPQAILNYLALMGWSHPDGKEVFSLDEFIEKLDLKKIDPVGPVFDITKLEWINGEYIRKMSDGDLYKRLDDYLPKDMDRKNLKALIPLIKERIKKLSDFVPLTSFLFEDPEYERVVFEKLKINNPKEALEKVLQKLIEMKKPWDAKVFEETFRKLADELNLKAGDMFQFLRVAISGKLVTPPLFESMQILGEEKSIERLKKVVSLDLLG